MCGITGYIRVGGLEDNAPSNLARMMSRLYHRGPDGRGQYLDRELGLAMGHTRLSIIDLSRTGDQPLVEKNGDVVLTVNGEFYDYKTHRAQLTRQGDRFSTKTDSELAIKLYRRYGLDFASRLRGEFAIALFDSAKKRLVLVRDRFGVRPLFFHITEKSVFYGSEIKSLLAHPDVPRRICKRASLHQMMQTMVPGMTAFEEIQALLPGQMMVIDLARDRLRPERKCYWDINFPAAEEHEVDPDPDEYIEGVADQLVDAVRVRLEADVPVGCYLSGGIDSCCILGLSTAMQQSPVKAFTISFESDAYDEAAIATEMAVSTGADQEVLPIGANELYGEPYERAVWHSERTFYNTLGVAKWHMSRKVQECGYKVVVTGEGSDELFGGYPFFKRGLFSSCNWRCRASSDRRA